jgi:hypothetical protein
MSFIKTGDGKIIGMVESEDLTEDQKKAIKAASQEIAKKSIIAEEKSSELKDNKC